MDAPTGLILCGGNAERLGRVDKPLRHFGERPLIARVVEGLRPQVLGVIISANRNHTVYRQYGDSVVSDGRNANRGPLAGIAAALEIAHGPDLICVPGDAPSLPSDLVARLLVARGTADIVYAHDGSGPQPLCCLLRTSLLTSLLDYLDAGGDTPREWFNRHHAVVAGFPENSPWGWSINTDDEWRDAEHRFQDTGLNNTGQRPRDTAKASTRNET